MRRLSRLPVRKLVPHRAAKAQGVSFCNSPFPSRCPMSDATKFGHYRGGDGAAALAIRAWLMPVEGPDGVLFPSTYAAGDYFPGGYNIDGDPNGKNVCLIDSVGAQANRIEPLFAEDKY